MNHSLPSAEHGRGAPRHAGITPVKGLLVLAAIVVVVAMYLTLNYAMGLTESWAGFIFLVCWAVSQMDLSELASCAVGAFAGVLVGYAIQTLPPVLGPAALAPILCLILAMVYCQIMGRLKLIVNLTTMTFLTIASMPLVQAHVSFPNVFATLAFGVIYFAGLVAMGRWFVKRAAAKQSAAPRTDTNDIGPA
ncbi:MAG: hypothetical protein WCB10_11900 [Steroidobacteraceae bacterium]